MLTDGVASTVMVQLQSIFKKAYWSLAAGGLVYMAFVVSLTYPTIQRLWVGFLSLVLVLFNLN